MAKSSALGPGTEVFPAVRGFDADVPAAVRSSLSDPSHAENFLFFRETVRHGQSAAHLQKRVHAQQYAEPADHDGFGAFVHLGVIFSKAPDLDRYADEHALAATFANLRLDVNPPNFSRFIAI